MNRPEAAHLGAGRNRTFYRHWVGMMLLDKRMPSENESEDLNNYNGCTANIRL